MASGQDTASLFAVIIQTIANTHTAKDIQNIFKCGRKKAYEIMHITGFPSFRIDTSLYVEKSELEKWIKQQCGKVVRI